MSREITQNTLQPIVSKEDLLIPFISGAKPPALHQIGLETEKIGVSSGHDPVPFEGPNGIERILITCAQRYNWKPIYDQGRVIALEKGKKAITLEPGGQLELSGEPYRSVHQVHDELQEHLEEISSVSDAHNVQWLGVGIHPFAKLESIPWMPKSRYAIMKAYYDSKAGMAHQMMKMTASTQVNLDYENENDARIKMRVGSILGPIVGAMMANSAVEEGHWNGFNSRRLQIWKNTDPDRCGIQSFFVDGSFTFEKYRDYAMHIPMYFIVREGRYIDKTSMTFAQYLENAPEKKLMTDWMLHLTTLFPDVRLKTHLEFRTADATKPDLTIALVAFWVGLLYDATALEEAHALLSRYNYDDVLTAMVSASENGLQAEIGRDPILEVARKLMHMAVLGLSRIDQRESTSQLRYLEPLRDLLDRGRSPAEELRRRFFNTITIDAFKV